MIEQQNQANQSRWGIVRVLVTATGSFLILLPLLFLLQLNAAAADGKASPATHAPLASDATSADCTTASTVPLSECLALVDLYTKTNGSGWITHTHWLQFGANAPCGWYGVVCNDGHVRQLLLAGNLLSGTLPLSISNFQELRRLRLENNSLLGRVPPSICALSKLTDLSLAYNALFTLRQSVRDCLAPLEADWLATQTTTPANLRLTEILTDGLRFSWTPISYTADGGYYEIATAPLRDGPYTPHGTTTDKITSSYLVSGLNPGQTYFVRVRAYTPAHGDQPSDLHSIAAQGVGVTKAETGRVLVAAYFPADNDLATEIPYVIERIRRGTAYNPNVQTAMLVDARQDGDTKLLEIANGIVITTDVVMEEWGVNELDTADPAVLAWFLQYARNQYPSERNVAAIIGHGVALAPEVDWAATTASGADAPVVDAGANRPANDQIPPLPKEHDYSPSDVTNRGYLSVNDVGEALMAATDNGANPFDVIFFDQCFQGSLDILYEVRNSASLYVASPNYAWLVAAYDRYLTRFLPTATPGEMARAIIDNYEAALDSNNPNAIFAITNSNLLAIATAVSELGDALKAATEANQVGKIASAMLQSKYVDTTQCGNQNLQLGPPDELIGLESFGGALQAEFVGDPYGIAVALSALQPLLANVERRSILGRPYLAPGQFWDYGNSLTVLAPLSRNALSAVAWRASLYHDSMPMTATWSVDPTQAVTVTKSLAYVRDGHWDEFLDVWYLGLKPTVGQWCQYIPPVQVVLTETAVLTLTPSAVTTDSLHLTWTPTDDSSAVEYWLYGINPYAVNWVVEQVLPLANAGAEFTELDKGDYRYRVVAHNDDGQIIAQSNEVTVTIAGAPPEEEWGPLVLPLILHEEATDADQR